MDITFHPVSGVTQAYQAPTVKTPSTGSEPSSAAAQDVVEPVLSSRETSDTSDAAVSASRQNETAQREAELSFKNVYALGDQEFSIFKDATGKYITRYISLRDGKVTYTPAPTYVKPQQSTGTSGPARVAISA